LIDAGAAVTSIEKHFGSSGTSSTSKLKKCAQLVV